MPVRALPYSDDTIAQPGLPPRAQAMCALGTLPFELTQP